MDLPTLEVIFDDGATVTVEAKARDLLAAEQSGHPFDASTPMGSLYAIACAGLQRMQRAGVLNGDVKVPGSVEELAEVADVGAVEDPKGG